MTDQWTRVAARIESYQDWAVEIERELTALPAIAPESGGQGELRKALALERICHSFGLRDIERVDAPDSRAEGELRPNLIIRLPAPPSSRATGTLWIMSHLDVVGEGDRARWHSDPWKLHREGDKLFGRGVEDNQQGIVSSLLLARALVEEQALPARPVALLFVADEEFGSVHGIQHVLEKKGTSLFAPDDLIVVPDGGRPDGTQIEVAEKSILWVKFTVLGRSAHASTPERGINAHRASAHLVVTLDRLHQRFADRDHLFDPPVSTFEPTKREPNVSSVNILPGEDVFYLDCRVLPRYPLSDVEDEIERRCRAVAQDFGVNITWEAVQREPAASPTAAAAPLVLALQRAVRNVYGVEARAEGIGGGTVAAHLRRAGYPAVVWSRTDETMHGPNEYVLLSNILGDAKVFAFLALHP